MQGKNGIAAAGLAIQRILLRIRNASLTAALALGSACLVAATSAVAQQFDVIGANVQKRANGVLTLMGYQLTPDVTTSSLSISDSATSNPDLTMVTLGGGFTVSREFPLYLEGTAGYSRYDPTFVATQGQDERPVPVKWNSISGTGGIGWDFRIAENLVLRPIFNFSLGHVESDSAIAGRLLEGRTGAELDFLQNGRMNAYGLGGSLMLDYERFRPEGDIDVELRYTNINLRTFDSSAAVKGSVAAQSVNLWSRWRAPTGMTLLERPLRYVLEYTHTTFFGALDGVLGFNHLNAFGVGLEVDTSKYDIFVTRARMVVRYVVGEGVSGVSVGLAVSF